MGVLRQHRDSLMAMLEAFIHDPLIKWRLLQPPPPPQQQQRPSAAKTAASQHSSREASPNRAAASAAAATADPLGTSLAPAVASQDPSMTASRPAALGARGCSPRCSRLRPWVSEAAALGVRGCDPRCLRLRPCAGRPTSRPVSRAAIRPAVSATGSVSSTTSRPTLEPSLRASLEDALGGCSRVIRSHPSRAPTGPRAPSLQHPTWASSPRTDLWAGSSGLGGCPSALGTRAWAVQRRSHLAAPPPTLRSPPSSLSPPAVPKPSISGRALRGVGYSADPLQLLTQDHAATPLEHARQRQWAAQQSSSELHPSEYAQQVNGFCRAPQLATHTTASLGPARMARMALGTALEERPCRSVPKS